jgi:hypothetical protein
MGSAPPVISRAWPASALSRILTGANTLAPITVLIIRGRYSNHPAGMTLGASRTAIFGHVTERCDLIVIGGGASGGTLAHTEIDKRPKRLTFLSRPREVRYR